MNNFQFGGYEYSHLLISKLLKARSFFENRHATKRRRQVRRIAFYLARLLINLRNSCKIPRVETPLGSLLGKSLTIELSI